MQLSVIPELLVSPEVDLASGARLDGAVHLEEVVLGHVAVEVVELLGREAGGAVRADLARDPRMRVQLVLDARVEVGEDLREESKGFFNFDVSK